MSKQNTNNFSLMDFVDEENDRQMRELEGKVAELTQMVSSSSEINKQIETEKNEAISELKTLKNEFKTMADKNHQLESFNAELFENLKNINSDLEAQRNLADDRDNETWKLRSELQEAKVKSGQDNKDEEMKNMKLQIKNLEDQIKSTKPKVVGGDIAAMREANCKINDLMDRNKDVSKQLKEVNKKTEESEIENTDLKAELEEHKNELGKVKNKLKLEKKKVAEADGLLVELSSKVDEFEGEIEKNAKKYKSEVKTLRVQVECLLNQTQILEDKAKQCSCGERIDYTITRIYEIDETGPNAIKLKFTKRPAEEIWSRHLLGDLSRFPLTPTAISINPVTGTLVTPELQQKTNHFMTKITINKNMKQCSVGAGPETWTPKNDSVLVGEDNLSIGYQNCGYVYLFGILVCKDLPSYEDGDNVSWGLNKSLGFLFFMKNDVLVWCCSLYDRSEVLACQVNKDKSVRILEYVGNFVPVVSMVQSQKFCTKFDLCSPGSESFDTFGARNSAFDL